MYRWAPLGHHYTPVVRLARCFVSTHTEGWRDGACPSDEGSHVYSGLPRVLCRWQGEYERSLQSTRTVFERAPVDPAPRQGQPTLQPSRAAAAGGGGRGSDDADSSSAVPDAWGQELLRSARDGVDRGSVHGSEHESADPSHSMASMHAAEPNISAAEPEFVTVAATIARDARSNERLQGIQEAMRGNLRRQMWLGGFEPLSMGCPLLGRRVSAAAVSEWAALAWDCDGLGFSWACLGQ